MSGATPSLLPDAYLTERQELAETQKREGWFCYACARWLPGGVGAIRTLRGHIYPGLYCNPSCRGGAYE